MDNIVFDTRNVKDMYKGWLNDLIREDLIKKQFPFAVFMCQINGDFNLASLIRSANSFGASQVYYYGPKKHFDRRGAVGVYHYTKVQHFRDFEDVKKLKEKYTFVALENNIESCVPIHQYKMPKNSLLIVGEESGGISQDVLELADAFVEIPSFGSVRSMNAAVAGSIAMYEWMVQNA